MSTYLIFGEDTFLVEERVEELVRTELPTERPSPAVTLDQLLELSQATGLFDQNKQIWIKQPAFLTQTLTDEEFEKVPALLQLVAQNGHRLILQWNDKLDQRKKLVQFFKKNATCEEKTPFKDWEQEKVIQWLNAKAKHMGKKLEPGAAFVLEQLWGNQLRFLKNELEKCALFVGHAETITQKDVEAVVSGGGASAFLFSEAVKKADGPRIALEAHKLLDQGEDPVKLMGLLGASLRLYTQLLYGLKEGKTQAQLAQELGKNPYYLKQIIPSIQKAYSLPKLTALYHALAKADLHLKSGVLKPEAAFQIVLTHFYR